MAKNWIAKATAGAHGEFAARAKKAGMSTAGFIRYLSKHGKVSTHLKRQASLAKTLMSFHRQ